MLNIKLVEELLANLPWNAARIKCAAILIIAILRHRTVNLTILATEGTSDATNESRYRRFQNFFLKFAMPIDSVGSFTLSKLQIPALGWVLAMDRTNWKFGKKHINILTVGVVVNKIAFPIAWVSLPQKTKRGNSNSKQRIALLERVLLLIDAKDIRVLTMDREFEGKEWLQWLDDNGLKYVLRIKGNTLIDNQSAKELTNGKQLRSPKSKSVWGLNLLFSGCRIKGKNTRDDFLYLVSNSYHGSEALAFYRQRWGIEQLFSHLKKRGYDLEATHMSEGVKIDKLFALVALAFLISYSWGCELKTKNKSTKNLEKKSIFRRGLEDILRLLSNPDLFQDELADFSAWLGSPKFDNIFVV